MFKALRRVRSMQESAPCKSPLHAWHRDFHPVTGWENPPCFITIFQPKMIHQSLKEKIPVYFRYSLFDTIEREGGFGSAEQIVEFEEFWQKIYWSEGLIFEMERFRIHVIQFLQPTERKALVTKFLVQNSRKNVFLVHESLWPKYQ